MSARPSSVWRLIVASLALATVAAMTPLAANAASAATCDLVPILRDVTVNQGLDSYPDLVRGKDTLVRLYLSMPSCAATGNQIDVESASLTVTGGTATGPIPSGDLGPVYPLVAPYGNAPINAPGDLTFVVPGSALKGTGNAITLSASLTYGWRLTAAGATTVATTTISSLPAGGPITRTMAAASNSLSVLVVPMGNAADVTKQQFPSEASTALTTGMLAASRTLPIPAGVGDLSGGGNGLRYTVMPTIMDLGPAGLNVMKQVNGAYLFCGDSLNFPKIQARLAQYLQAWNAANPAAKADRVLGAVWEAVSQGNLSSCYEGAAAPNGQEGWTRVFTSTTPSKTGAVLSHELGHTLGLEKGSGSAHSTYIAAENPAKGRAFNVTMRQWLQDNRSVMNLSSGWDEVNTLFEQSPSGTPADTAATDWSYALCRLTPGATTGCTSPGSVGTAAAIANTDVIVVSGSTDGTPAGTDLHSYVAKDVQPTLLDSTSPYHLVQLGPGGVTLADDRIAVQSTTADESGANGTPPTLGSAAIDAARPLSQGAQRIEVRRDGVAQPLYDRDEDQIPRFTDIRTTATGGTTANVSDAPGDDLHPAISPDGALVAWTDATGRLMVRATSLTTASTVLQGNGNGAWSAPAWNPAGDALAVVQDRSIRVLTIDRSVTPPRVTSDRVVYNDRIQTLANPEASAPTWSGDGKQLAAAINDDIWIIDTTFPVSPTNPLICLVTNVPAQGCYEATDTSDVSEADPAWAWDGSNAVVYEHGADLWKVDGASATPTRTQASFLAEGGDPAWGATSSTLAFTRGGSVWLEENGTATQLTTGDDVAPSLTAGAVAVVYSRNLSGQRDVLLQRSERRVSRVTATDDHPELLRLDVYVRCGSDQPILVALKPTGVDGTSASWDLSYSTAAFCTGAQIVLALSDGWWRVVSAPTGSSNQSQPPVPAIYAPTNGAERLQYDAIPLAGAAHDAEDGTLSGSNLQWFLSGPGFSSRPVGQGPNPPDVQPPVASSQHGWTPGAYVVVLRATDSSGGTKDATAAVTILRDEDHDGIPARDEDPSKNPCYPLNADQDPTNAWADYNGDGVPNVNDPFACTGVNFDPDTVNVSSSGQPVTVYIKALGRDLRRVKGASAVMITSIGRQPTSLTATSWTVTNNGTGVAQFDRQTFNQYLIDHRMVGFYVPVVVTAATTSWSVSGTDPTYPLTTRS